MEYSHVDAFDNRAVEGAETSDPTWFASLSPVEAAEVAGDLLAHGSPEDVTDIAVLAHQTVLLGPGERRRFATFRAIVDESGTDGLQQAYQAIREVNLL